MLVGTLLNIFTTKWLSGPILGVSCISIRAPSKNVEMLLSLSKIWPTIFNFLEHENCLNEILDDLFFKKYDLNLSSEK